MATTQINQIQFTKQLASGRILTRDADTFEEYCIKNKDCFESIPDDAIIKPYFDIDYKLKEDEEFDEYNANTLLF